MKIVVFGALKRTGALHDGSVVDLSYAYAKYLRERTDEPNPLEMAEVVVPSELSRLIEGGSRTLDAVQTTLDYLFDQAQDKFGLRGEALVHPQPMCAYTRRGRITLASHAPAGTSPTMLRPWP